MFLTITSNLVTFCSLSPTWYNPNVMATDENGNPILDKKGKPIFRSMTDKNIKYRLKKRNGEITELINSVKEMSKLLLTIMYELSNRRDDKSRFKNTVAKRIVEARPKLSEAAFGHDDGKDFICLD